jgi:hypothetical protein
LGERSSYVHTLPLALALPLSHAQSHRSTFTLSQLTALLIQSDASRACIHMYTYVYMCIHVYTCVYICIHMYTYVCIFCLSSLTHTAHCGKMQPAFQNFIILFLRISILSMSREVVRNNKLSLSPPPLPPPPLSTYQYTHTDTHTLTHTNKCRQ